MYVLIIERPGQPITTHRHTSEDFLYDFLIDFIEEEFPHITIPDEYDDQDICQCLADGDAELVWRIDELDNVQ